MNSSPVVKVDHLVKDYDSRHSGSARAVDDVSFTVRRGQTTALVGESGAGKTTIGSILTGLVSATSGRVEVCGEDRSQAAHSGKTRRRRASQLQVVPQDPFTSIDPTQRIGSVLDESVAAHRRLSSAERLQRVHKLLADVGLDARHARCTPRMLSGGQRQRVAIARALAAEPDVVVLDEAVSALDVSVQAQVLNLLRELQARTNVAYLFITHDLGVVRQIAHEVIVLRGGKVVEHGTTSSVLDSPEDAYTKLLLASTPKPGWRPVRRDEFLIS